MLVRWAINLIAGRSVEGAKLASELLILAETANDDSQRAEAHWAATCNDYWAGNFARSKYHSEQAIAVYQIESSIQHARFSTQNSGPLTLVYGGMATLALGDPVAARQLGEQRNRTCGTAQRPVHSGRDRLELCHLVRLSGDALGALAVVDRVLNDSKEHAFSFFIGLGNGLKGAALGMLGDHEPAIALIRDGLKRVEATGCLKLHQHHLTALANSYWALGQREPAWKALERGLEINNRDQERNHEAEIFRQRGRFLADESRPDDAESEFLRALEVARKQHAILRARAAADLAEFRIALGREVLESLAPLREALAGFDPAVQAPEVVRAAHS